MQDSAVLLHITRGPLTESVHRGHIAVIDHENRLIAEVGLSTYITFARSAAKPLQAVPVVESGAADRFGFTDEQIALLCASHNGEEGHTSMVRTMLENMGLGEAALGCGAHYPYYAPRADEMKASGLTPGRIHNNCSGKHSGMLALALELGAATESYMEPEHPVQRRMRQTIAEMADLRPDDIALGTDGCGVPVFGLPLDRLAYAFAKLGRPEGLADTRAEACRRITAAIRRAPFYIAGTGRFDTALIEATNGRIIGKMGAEGVFAMSISEFGRGIAIKIEDGAQRALYPVAVEVLSQLQLLSESELSALAPFHRPFIRNWEGALVGETKPVFRLDRTR